MLLSYVCYARTCDVKAKGLPLVSLRCLAAQIMVIVSPNFQLLLGINDIAVIDCSYRAAWDEVLDERRWPV